MSAWILEDSFKRWINAIQQPTVSHQTGIVERLVIRGSTAISRVNHPTQPPSMFLLEGASGAEEDALRRHLSKPASVQRSADAPRSVRFRVETESDLDLVKEVVQGRVDQTSTSRIKPVEGPWTQFIHWGKRFRASQFFQEHERDFKLRAIAALQPAREAVVDGSDNWLPLVRRGISAKDNILTSWRMHSDFLKWCEAEPDRAHEALEAIWNQSDEARIRTFLRFVPTKWVSGPGMRLSLATYLQMALGPSTTRCTGARRSISASS